MAVRHVLTSAVLLTAFGVFGTALVAGIAGFTEERIAANEEEALRSRLHEIVLPGMHDNDLLTDTIALDAPALNAREPAIVHIARKDGVPVAAVFRVVSLEGYSGAIRMLVGVDATGMVIGVRVTAHRETPGLGDDIEIERSDWIDIFRWRSLGNPPVALWNVRRDGGIFDQFTAATITARAVVLAVRRTLVYFEENRDTIMGPAEGSHATERPAAE